MTEIDKPLPAELARLAQRGTWFSLSDAQQVLRWLDREELPLLGIDASKPMANGNWILLLEPKLTVPDGLTASQSVAEGYRFLDALPEPDLMFEPVWPGH